MKPKLILPKPDLTGKFAHAQDTFRELGELWHEHELVERIYSDIQVHPHLKIDDELICLFDRPIFEEWSQHINTEYVLFGNPTPPKKFKHESSWIFWGRNPKKLEETRNNLLSYRERTIKTFFAGKIENPLQHQKRTQTQVDWSRYIEDFSCPVNGERKYTQEQYLEKVKQSKFGLCLPGYGNKCNREIELLGLGTVPIITKGVDVSDYFEPLIENVHYIYAEDGGDLLYKISRLTEEDWIYLSESGLEWYERNCSPSGSFETTMKIIDDFNKIPKSFSTMGNNKAVQDLELLYYSLRKQHPKHDIYIASDDHIDKWISSKKDEFLHSVNCLEKYSNKTRTDMEKENIFFDFVYEKAKSIDMALKIHGDTLFLDADQCVLTKIKVDNTKQIGLSPHLINKQSENNFGKFNVGFLYVNDSTFTTWWKDNSKRSKFFEQQVLDYVSEKFTTFEFEPEYNFGWWRLFECENSEERAKKFSYDTCLKYENKPVVSLHTHFFEDKIQNQSQFLANKFNEFIFNLLPNDNDVKKYIKTLKGDDGLILLQSYYNPKQEDRRAEIEYCLEQNLNNPNIQKVVLFLDNESVEYPEHSKIEALLTKDVAFPEEKGTFTFSMAFGYAMQKYKDSICCLINNDIFLDHDVFSDMTEIKNLIENNIVLSLSRHEYDLKTKTGVLDENFRRMMFAHTQDAWIFKANFCPKDSEFAPGTLGSDNAINDRLKKHGKVPINLGTKYKIYHVDTVRGKTSANFLNKDFRSKEREKYPEESGQLLTPDYGMINGMSLDQFAKQLNFNHIDTYEILCEMMTKKVKIKNR